MAISIHKILSHFSSNWVNGDYLRKKTFWYAILASFVFFTDIWIYFYLKNAPTPAHRAHITEEIQSPENKNLQDNIDELADPSEVQDNKELEKTIEN